MKTQPKYKICRRLGSGVYDKCQTEKFVLSESRKPAKRGMKRRSDYGDQLKEKQKIRLTYGITEKQFSRYVDMAKSAGGGRIPKKLVELLETRLDNVVYRLGLAPTRRSARQMVSHGHILVNDKKVKTPSFSLSEKNKISVRGGSKEKAVFQANKESIEKRQRPAWLAFSPKTLSGDVKSMPNTEDILGQYDVTSVIEFYSR